MSIKVGKQYKDAFKSICNLYKNGAVSKNVIENIEGNVIKLANNKSFEYVETDSPNRGTDFGMTKRGASWFAGFRGENIDDSDSSWKTLIENVAENYHSKYSFVEFREKNISLSEEENNENKEIILNFTKTFFKELKSSTLFDIEQEDKDNIDDIYCASLKMAIDNGSGEANIVLAKLFFRQYKKTLVPLLAEEGKEVQSYIKDILSDEKGEPEKVDSNKIDAVVGAVENVIKGDEFDKYFTLTSIEDDISIDKMIEKGPNDDVELNCRSVKVLGISHIRWNKNIYYLNYQGKSLLKFEVGISKKISCYCVNCGNNILVASNEILMKDAKENLHIDYLLPNFGLTNQELKLVETDSILSEHIFSISCSNVKTKRTNCSRICCISQVENINGTLVCKNCPYPEILFVDESGKYHLTKNLIFARDSFKMTPRIETKTCKNCYRTFTLDSIVNDNTCQFCHRVLSFNSFKTSDREKEELTKAYRKYKSILPIRVRLLGLFTNKYCFEEEDILIFLIGEKVYTFNKLEISDKGYIDGPKRMR